MLLLMSREQLLSDIAIMCWFRSRSRLGACLAFFALVLQFALSFAHVHLDRAPAPGHSSVLLFVHGLPNANPASQPASDESPRLADDYCAVCALIHLAGTIVSSEPPLLALPTAFAQVRSTVVLEFGLTGRQRAPFASRAPPIA
jgi:DUF2946 family protein